MRRFTDGAEYGDGLLFSSYTGTPWHSGYYRSGAYCYRITGTNNWTQTWPGSYNEFYWRGGIRTTSFDLRWTFRNSTTDMISFIRNAGTGLMESRRGSWTGTLLSTGITPILQNTWYLLEAHIIINDATGVLQFKIDGIDQGTYNGDTRNGTPTTCDSWYTLGPTSSEYAFDDLALNDTDNSDGLNDNSWCGDGRIELLVPNGNGYVSNWTGQDGDSVNNYLNVDEVPSDGDTTYNENGTATNKDACTLTDWTGTSKIALRVWPEGRIRDTVAAGNNVKLGIRASGTDYMSGNKSLLTSYSRITGTEYKTDPSDAAAWTDADIDGLEVVIETV